MEIEGHTQTQPLLLCGQGHHWEMASLDVAPTMPLQKSAQLQVGYLVSDRWVTK